MTTTVPVVVTGCLGDSVARMQWKEREGNYTTLIVGSLVRRLKSCVMRQTSARVISKQTFFVSPFIFIGKMGNMIAFAATKILRLSAVIFTSLDYIPMVPVVPV